MGTTLQVLLYALVAAASPLALTSTLIVLRTQPARLNGFVFALAFLLGEALLWVVLLTVGAATSLDEGHQDAAAVLKLVLGLLLLAAAWRVQRGSGSVPERREGPARGQALTAGLGRLTGKAAFPLGVLLGIGGPKRLTIAIVAATTVSVAGLTRAEEAGVVLLYCMVAGVLVWAPVAVFLVAGRRATFWLADAQEWLRTNQRPMTIYSLLVLGIFLVVDALAQLL